MMRFNILLLIVSLVPLFESNAFAQDNPFNSGQKNYPNWSPFTGVRWSGDIPFVRVVGGKEWYKIQTFHGLPIDAILGHCKSQGWDPKRRFTQDPVQIIRLMGHKIERSTSFQLKDKTGKVVQLKNVLMTEEARKQCVFPFNQSSAEYPDWSPYSSIKWIGNKPFIKVAAIPDWVELVSIHGVTMESIAKTCEDNGWNLKKRVAEDVVQLIRLMGFEIDKTTSLQIRDGAGKVIKLENVQMSSENLDSLKEDLERM